MLCWKGYSKFRRKFSCVHATRNDGIATMYERLLSSGIESRWRQEQFGFMTASRVQDRVQVKSRTRMVLQTSTTEKLKMDGKILTIFLLWILCLAIFLMAFIFEISRNCTLNMVYFRATVTKTEFL